MAIRWNTELLRDICIFPVAVADNELRFASHPQLKVLLWVAAHEKENADIDACAAALRLSRDTVEEAVQYWASRGVFCIDGTTVAAPAPAPVEEPSAPVAVPRPAAVKPQMKEVIRRQKDCPEFSALLEAVSARLGKPLSHGDMETLLYLYDTAGINGSVILMGVGYAVSRQKYSMRYIEEVLLRWQDNGITTVDAVDEHLRFLEKVNTAADKVRTILGQAKELSSRQREMAYTWIYTWHFSEDVIRFALQIASERTNTVIPYADKILAGWFQLGITDVAAAKKEIEKKPPAKRRKGQTEKTSLDIEGFETMLEDYVPPIPRKE